MKLYECYQSQYITALSSTRSSYKNNRFSIASLNDIIFALSAVWRGTMYTFCDGQCIDIPPVSRSQERANQHRLAQASSAGESEVFKPKSGSVFMKASHFIKEYTQKRTIQRIHRHLYTLKIRGQQYVSTIWLVILSDNYNDIFIRMIIVSWSVILWLKETLRILELYLCYCQKHMIQRWKFNVNSFSSFLCFSFELELYICILCRIIPKNIYSITWLFVLCLWKFHWTFSMHL